MGVPFSKEMGDLGALTQDIHQQLPYLKTRLWIFLMINISFISITITLLSAILLAILALIVTVSPDLVEERKRLVTPVVRRGVWGLLALLNGAKMLTGGERGAERESENGKRRNEREEGVRRRARYGE